MENSKLEPRFEDAGEMLIAGLNESYTFETRVNIGEQWHRFIPQLESLPGQVGGDAFGVVWNYKPGHGFDYLTGVEVKDASILPAGFSHLRLSPQKYAVFTHHKHVSALPETMDAIWNKWLPTSGHQPADAPCFERYTKDFNPETGVGGMEIWVAIKVILK